MLRRLLAHPLTRGVDLDDPRTTALHNRIVREKYFLTSIYKEWYGTLASQLPSGVLLELGSGGGFLAEHLEGSPTKNGDSSRLRTIASDVFIVPDVDVLLDARALPFGDATLDGIAMVDVLHHVPDVASFFREASRALRPGGRIAMVEPWVTTWSRFVYRRLHHEPFLPDAKAWEFPASGPLSGANGALPWIVFHRDRARFEREHPALRIVSIAPMMPWRYLVSGGVSMRSLAPGWTYSAFRLIERAANPWMHRLAMFAAIVVERR